MESSFTRRQALFGALAGSALLSSDLFLSRSMAHTGGRQGGLTTTKLSDNLYLVDGGGGNVAVLTGDVTVVVDSKLSSVTAPLIAEIGKISGKPTGILINTHWHGDHVGSNVEIGKAGALIIAHENTRKRLSVDTEVEFLGSKSPAMAKQGLPVVTFKDSLTIHENGENIHMQHVDPAHTDTDIFLHFENANVVHCGDLFFNGLYPFIDYSTKGWIGGMVASSDVILKHIDSKTKLIPGHGAVTNKEGLMAFRDMLEGIHGKVEPMVKAGKSEAEVVAAKPTADFDAKWGKGFLAPDKFASLVYRTIVKHIG